MEQKNNGTPESKFIVPIVYELCQSGGNAKWADILHAIERNSGSLLTDVDWESLTSGEIRWKDTSIEAMRLLINRGLISEESGEVILTEEGMYFSLLLEKGHKAGWRPVEFDRGLYESLKAWPPFAAARNHLTQDSVDEEQAGPSLDDLFIGQTALMSGQTDIAVVVSGIADGVSGMQKLFCQALQTSESVPKELCNATLRDAIGSQFDDLAHSSREFLLVAEFA